MSETILHAMKTAAAIKDRLRRGSWPLSPKLSDTTRMADYHERMAASGSATDVTVYESLRGKLEKQGVLVPVPEEEETGGR